MKAKRPACRRQGDGRFYDRYQFNDTVE